MGSSDFPWSPEDLAQFSSPIEELLLTETPPSFSPIPTEWTSDEDTGRRDSDSFTSNSHSSLEEEEEEGYEHRTIPALTSSNSLKDAKAGPMFPSAAPPHDITAAPPNPIIGPSIALYVLRNLRFRDYPLLFLILFCDLVVLCHGKLFGRSRISVRRPSLRLLPVFLPYEMSKSVKAVREEKLIVPPLNAVRAQLIKESRTSKRSSAESRLHYPEYCGVFNTSTLFIIP